MVQEGKKILWIQSECEFINKNKSNDRKKKIVGEEKKKRKVSENTENKRIERIEYEYWDITKKTKKQYHKNRTNHNLSLLQSIIK